MRNVRLLHLLPFLLLFLLSACTTAGQGGSANSSSSLPTSSAAAQVSDLPEGDFVANSAGNMFGTVYVRGFATVQKVQEPFCETRCAEYDYVFFTVTDTGNQNFREFLTSQQGNSYVGTQPLQVGLGCVENGVISYVNHSDKFGHKDFTLDRPLSAAILGSAPVAPVTLRLAKETLTAGSGAPACYSHMTEISLWSASTVSSAAGSVIRASSAPRQAAVKNGCVIGGCSSQLCIEEGDDGMSTCEWREAYACYQGQTCERQASGECGWTMTAELTACLQNAQ